MSAPESPRAGVLEAKDAIHWVSAAAADGLGAGAYASKYVLINANMIEQAVHPEAVVGAQVFLLRRLVDEFLGAQAENGAVPNGEAVLAMAWVQPVAHNAPADDTAEAEAGHE